MRIARLPTDRSPRAPRLMLLVFGIFLVLVGVTASTLVAVTSTHLADTTLSAVVEGDRSLVDLFADGNLTVDDLEPPGPDEARLDHLRGQVDALVRSGAITAVEIRDRNGSLVVASDRSEAPAETSVEPLRQALLGKPSATLVDTNGRSILVEHLPLAAEDGEVFGAVLLQRDVSSATGSLEDARRDIMLITVIAAVVLAAIMVLVFRAAHHRLLRQQEQLVEASRRDALTGMLNHGSIVAELVEQLERARAADAPIAVALIDIDNFRLFNDTHGHDAGDTVLLRVAELVDRMAGPAGVAARYGPDEFLVISPGQEAAGVESSANELRAAMREIAVRFGDSEELPISVSIGIGGFPRHATSVTPLLSEASVALGEAQASGGDAVVVARSGEERPTHAGGFDVLQGLVLAVDTKDRYTKRHSEDVARYGVFLARRMKLDDLLEPIRLAGLLHDVGKIGIPDRLLRKPSRLSDDEVKVFNQHVALGDAIVRDLPDIEQVRAGIRHHHERWDGGGYLDGLKGEEIPIIARIIAVADTFSAMTTTRPYRKALSVDEAVRRLRAAAGTQLQPDLVDAFVTGIEEDPAAPKPNEASDVWLPLRVA